MECGISFTVTYHGLVLADFSDWRTEAEPCPDGLLDRSPFACPIVRSLSTFFRLGRRVAVLNAHQACLLALLGIESEEDFYTPRPRPVTPETAWVGWDDEDVTIPATEIADYLAAIDESDGWSIFNRLTRRAWLRPPPRALSVSCECRSCSRSRPQISCCTPLGTTRRIGSTRRCFTRFPAAEAVLRELWGRHVDQRDVEIRGANGEYRLTAERRRRLVGSEFTVNVLLETIGLFRPARRGLVPQGTTSPRPAQRFGAPRRSCVGSRCRGRDRPRPLTSSRVHRCGDRPELRVDGPWSLRGGAATDFDGWPDALGEECSSRARRAARC